MERMVLEYLANALWQVAALALGAWVLLRMWNPSSAAQHRVWVAAMALSLLLPLRGVVPVNQHTGSAAGPAAPLQTAAIPPTVITPATASSPVAFDSVGKPGGTVLSRQTGWRKDGGPGFALLTAAAGLHRVSVSATAARWIVGLWLAAALWGLLLLARAWSAARHLVADSREVALGVRERAAFEDCARRLGVAPPRVRQSDGIAGPVVVGSFAPVLLWPPGMARRSGDELRAALCHELAHIRRRDYAMNLLCEAASVPLKWHPATHGVGRRIRATREMACDAMAAEAMESETVYAECLVHLARSIVGGGLAAEPVSGSAAAGLFNGNVMEERVMRLMRGRATMSLRARTVRLAAGLAAMAAAMAFAGMFHVVPAMAQSAPPAPMPPTVAHVPAAPPAPPAAAALPPAPPTSLMLSAPPALPQTGAPDPQATPPVPPTSVVPKVAAMPAVPKVAHASAVPKDPAAPAVPKVQAHRSHRSEPAAIPDEQERNLTPAERARIKKQLEEAQRKIAEATAKIDSPEFRKQMEDAQTAALHAQTMLDSAEFKQKMANARKQIDETMARLNSPEFQKKIQVEIDAAAAVNGAQFQKQMADAQRQVAEATARINSPEFKKQIEEAAQAAAKVNSAEFQKQMAEVQKQVADALANVKSEQEKENAGQQKK